MTRLPSLAVLRSVESDYWPATDMCDARARWNPTQAELDLIAAAEIQSQRPPAFRHLLRGTRAIARS